MLKIVLIALAMLSIAVFAQDPNLHIYIAYGQSNMAGVGPTMDMDFHQDPRFLVMRAAKFSDQEVGEFYPAAPPMANSMSSIGIVDFFGRKMVQELPDSIRVAVADVAIGGQSIDLFDKDRNTAYVHRLLNSSNTWVIPLLLEYGGNLHQRIVELGKIAKKKGVVKGFLFHQGEADAQMEDWPERVKKVYDDLIKEIGLDPKKTPILIGELVPNGDMAWRNNAVKEAADLIPNGHLISSQGCLGFTEKYTDDLTCVLHFTREGYETLGYRYADKMLELLKNPIDFDSAEASVRAVEVTKPKLFYDYKQHAIYACFKKHGKDFYYQVTGRRKNN